MKHHYCVICWSPVGPPQQTTCGGASCRDSWKNMDTDARTRRKLMAFSSPSDRQVLLLEEAEATNIARSQRIEEAREALSDYQQTQSHDSTPQFLRDILSPENAPINPKQKQNEVTK